MSRQRAVAAVVVAASLATSAALLIPLPNDNRSAWVRQLLDLGHVPLFGLLTVCFWWAFQHSAWRAIGMSAVIAGACEVGQPVVGRSANPTDFLRGILGSLLAVVVVNALKRPRTARRMAVSTTVAAVLLVWPVSDSVPVLFDAAVAYRSFPVICDFRTRWEATRWESDTVLVERVQANSPNDGWTGRMLFTPREGDAASVVLFPVVRDWRGYRRLCFTFSFSGEPLSILISVRDGLKVTPPAKRFDLVRRYESGTHHVCIDLDSLARGDEFAPLDFSRVQSLHLGLNQLTGPRELLLHSVHLE